MGQFDPFTPFHVALVASAVAGVYASKAWGILPGILVGIVAGKAADELLRPRAEVSIGLGEIVTVEEGSNV